MEGVNRWYIIPASPSLTPSSLSSNEKALLQLEHGNNNNMLLDSVIAQVGTSSKGMNSDDVVDAEGWMEKEASPGVQVAVASEMVPTPRGVSADVIKQNSNTTRKADKTIINMDNDEGEKEAVLQTIANTLASGILAKFNATAVQSKAWVYIDDRERSVVASKISDMLWKYIELLKTIGAIINAVSLLPPDRKIYSHN